MYWSKGSQKVSGQLITGQHSVDKLQNWFFQQTGVGDRSQKYLTQYTHHNFQNSFCSCAPKPQGQHQACLLPIKEHLPLIPCSHDGSVVFPPGGASNQLWLQFQATGLQPDLGSYVTQTAHNKKHCWIKCLRSASSWVHPEQVHWAMLHLVSGGEKRCMWELNGSDIWGLFSHTTIRIFQIYVYDQHWHALGHFGSHSCLRLHGLPCFGLHCALRPFGLFLAAQR